MDSVSFLPTVELFKSAKTIGLACYVNLDGDALGSMLALYLAFQSWNSVEVAASFSAPFRLQSIQSQ